MVPLEELIMKTPNKMAVSFLLLFFLSQEKAFGKNVRVPIFDTCAELQNYFNYRSRNYDGGKTRYVGFEKIAMDFDGNDLGG
jgi:hypothetical protein